MRRKHRRDQNHGKNGLVSGNPRYNRAKFKANATKTRSDGDRETLKHKTMVGW